MPKIDVISGGTLVNGYSDDPTTRTPLHNPLDALEGRVRPPPDSDGDGDPPLCRLMPSSMAAKLNKLSVRSGLYKVCNDFAMVRSPIS